MDRKRKRQTKQEKGITLVALVVTIIVLLILAGVTIAMVLGQNGIFEKAQVAAENTNSSQELEQVRLAVLEARTNSLVDKKELEMELKTSIGKVYPGATVSKTGEGENIKYTITLPNGHQYIVDSKGNITKGESTTPPTEETIVDTVKIPEGFTHKAGEKREEGIVVADKVGNEYVWIPVTVDDVGNPTEPYKDSDGLLTTSKGTVEIQLRRSDFGNGDSLVRAPEYEPEIQRIYREDSKGKHDSSLENAIADDIDVFKTSVAKNGGYFFGRYEAGIEGGTLSSTTNTENKTEWTGYTGGTLVCKPGQQVWNYITQPKASKLCQNIDTQNGYKSITSDLVNSYAWDTAIKFIQACGIESNSSNYAKQMGMSTTTYTANTGEAILLETKKVDKQCNIYDMAGNVVEWSTETYSASDTPCVYRGGESYARYSNTSYRMYLKATDVADTCSFRPILYWNN